MYADVLVVLNILVDYFLIGATGCIIHINIPFIRQLLSAVLGGVSSLVIFLPPMSAVGEFALQGIICISMSLITFGIRPFRRTLRAAAVLLGITFGYGGAMMALWYITRPHGMVINNSVVYFDISPVYLIVFSAIGYIAVNLARRLLSKNAPTAECCTVEVFISDKSRVLTALIDTGNSLEDTFTGGEVIITDENAFMELLGFVPKAQDMPERYRAIVCNGVSGQALLDAFRCDRAVITYSGTTVNLHRPILAISRRPLGGDYDAIINPRAVL